MESIARYLEKRLRLKLNRDKRAVARPWNRKFLGNTMTSHHRTKLKVSPQSEKRAKAHIKVTCLPFYTHCERGFPQIAEGGRS